MFALLVSECKAHNLVLDQTKRGSAIAAALCQTQKKTSAGAGTSTKRQPGRGGLGRSADAQVKKHFGASFLQQGDRALVKHAQKGGRGPAQ